MSKEYKEGLSIQGINVDVEYEYDHENMVMGSGSGDSGHPSCTSLDIISIHIKPEDWPIFLNSFKKTSELLQAIEQAILKTYE